MPLQSTLGRIEEADEEDERPSTQWSQKGARSKKKDKADETLSVMANRFDFRINNNYRIANMRVDEKGERVQALSHLHGRVVASTGITYKPVTAMSAQDTRKSVAI